MVNTPLLFQLKSYDVFDNDGCATAIHSVKEQSLAMQKTSLAATTLPVFTVQQPQFMTSRLTDFYLSTNPNRPRWRRAGRCKMLDGFSDRYGFVGGDIIDHSLPALHMVVGW